MVRRGQGLVLLERLESDDGLGHSLRSNLKTAEERLETQVRRQH